MYVKQHFEFCSVMSLNDFRPKLHILKLEKRTDLRQCPSTHLGCLRQDIEEQCHYENTPEDATDNVYIVD